MREIVIGAFNHSIQEDGFVEPRNTAQKIAAEIGISDPYKEQQIARTIFEYPTAEFVRPGAFDTLKELVSPSDPSVTPGTATIWTDDYSIRIASSGIGDLRKNISSEARKRLRVAFDKDDKVSLLPELALRAVQEGSEAFWIVDDNIENLKRSHELITYGMGKEAGDPAWGFIFVDNGSPPHQRVQRVYDAPINFIIPSIEDLITIRNREYFQGERVSWAIDFNGPILDRGAYTAAREDAVIGQIERYGS